MKKLLSVILAIAMLLQISVFAEPNAVETADSAGEVPEDIAEEKLSDAELFTQSRTKYFNDDYTLKGNPIDDLLAVAKAQVGLTESDLKYTEAWCADFVADCAKLAKIDDDIIPHNYSNRANCSSLYNYMKNNCGAEKVTSRKKGDIVFYYCSSCSRYVHVGIVLDSTYTIEGNCSNKVVKKGNSYTDSKGHTLASGTVRRDYLRPAYVPSKPTIKSHSDVTQTSVKIKWNAVSGATEYKLEYRPAGGSWDTDAKSQTTSSTSLNVTGLNSGKLYWFRLYAKNDAGTSKASDSYGVYLKGNPPEVKPLSTSSLEITWPATGGSSNYELQYKKSGGTWTTINKTFGKDERKYIHTGLEAGTQYYYRTKAYNFENEGLESDVSYNGYGGYTYLKSPVYTSNSSNSVSIKWDRGTMSGDYTYTYKIYRNGTVIGTTSSKSYTDNTVKPNTTYTYKVSVLKHADEVVEIIDSETLTLTTPSCSHTYSSWTTIKSATCTASGTKTRTCTKCSAVETGTISATGHSYSAWTTTTAATCTANGVSTRTCSKCSAKETQTISATGHNMSDWVVVKEATCTENGERKKTCNKCGYSQTEVISSLHGHDLVTIVSKDATCTESGIKEISCANCDYFTTEEISASGHEFSSWTTTDATCTKPGVSTRTCKKCSEQEIVETPAIGSHDYVEIERVEPTDVDGYVKYECSRCEDSYTDVLPVTAVNVTDVKLDEETLSLEIGETATLVATVTPSNATNKEVTWTSSNTSVATVNNGVVTAVGEGSATITVTTEDGNKTASCTITVNKKEEPDVNAKAVFTFSDVTGRPGETIDIKVSLKTDEAVNTIVLSGFEYDESILTFDGFYDYEHLKDIAALPPAFDKDKMAVTIGLAQKQAFDGDICTLRFVINPDAPDGAMDRVSAKPLIKISSVEVSSRVDASKVTVRTQMLGDIDGDEDVDIDDAVLLFQHSVLPDLYTIEYSGSIDFDKDGFVSIEDAVLLFQYSVLPDLYPIA